LGEKKKLEEEKMGRSWLVRGRGARHTGGGWGGGEGRKTGKKKQRLLRRKSLWPNLNADCVSLDEKGQNKVRTSK